MNEIFERVSDAISSACDYALPPRLLERCARAAIEAVADDLESKAEACQFAQDRESLLCAVEELDVALKSSDQ